MTSIHHDDGLYHDSGNSSHTTIENRTAEILQLYRARVFVDLIAVLLDPWQRKSDGLSTVCSTIDISCDAVQSSRQES